MARAQVRVAPRTAILPLLPAVDKQTKAGARLSDVRDHEQVSNQNRPTHVRIRVRIGSSVPLFPRLESLAGKIEGGALLHLQNRSDNQPQAAFRQRLREAGNCATAAGPKRAGGCHDLWPGMGVHAADHWALQRHSAPAPAAQALSLHSKLATGHNTTALFMDPAQPALHCARLHARRTRARRAGRWTDSIHGIHVGSVVEQQLHGAGSEPPRSEHESRVSLLQRRRQVS